MPFVLRVVQPKHLSRTSLHDADGSPKVKDDELLAVTNCTLSNALKQLASLVLLANDIFDDLTKRLDEVGERSKSLQLKINRVEERVEQYDPKKVPVPEGDLSAFALRKDHYVCNTDLIKNLFESNTKPKCLIDMYEAAGRVTPDPSGASLPAGRRSPPLLCTPVLGSRQRKLRQKVDVDIETRRPAAIEELRKWTSSEALGDATVAPSVVSKITANVTLAHEDMSDGGGFSSGDDEPIDHKLPSPEEQFIAIASKFCPELVPIDISGRGFDRMCVSRRSLLYVDTSCDRNQTNDSQTVRRRTRSRKPRGKRRNTIAGTDQKEIRDAIAGDASSPAGGPESPDSGAVMRSHSSDLLKKSPFEVQNKKSHFNSLRQWGRSRLRLINRSPSESNPEKQKASKSPTVQDIDDINIYETVTMRRKKNATISKTQDRKISHERNNSYSSSEKSIGIPVSGAMTLAVKLREVGSTSRRRRTNEPMKDEPHSSSGNWSASSESGRTSIGSEITSTTAAPRSSTSAATSSNSINALHGPPSSIVSRRRFINTSGSGSVTSEGTLTPDIVQDFHDDMETSSEFSCDTEGYYTSFHMDSGLKTLKEEEISLPITPLHTTSTFSNSSGNQTILTAESEYELFGKGSTSTTTSSAGTVCTTLLAAGSDRSLVLGPTVPERKSSLSTLNKSRSSSGSSGINLERSCSNSSDKMATIRRNTNIKNRNSYQLDLNQSKKNAQETVIADVHEIHTQCTVNTGAESPDSGHNTSSSPIDDSVSSAHGGKLSCSEMDYSESSDIEGVDRIERIRVKTTINSSRIPSMCVITPNNSDDESIKSCKQDAKTNQKISDRPKLELPPQETDLDTIVFNDEVTNYDNVYVDKDSCPKPKSVNKSNEVTPVETIAAKTKKNTRSYRMPLNNLMCKLKEVFPQKLSMRKAAVPKEPETIEHIYGDNGEYVTIADVRNNNEKVNIYNTGGVYYSNDVVKRNLQTVLSGKLHETEYVSLNELPSNITPERIDCNDHLSDATNESLKRYGAKVTLDSSGKVVYSSDSLKRRKGAHTTFEPGPFVKELSESIDECDSKDVTVVAVNVNKPEKHFMNGTRPLSPQLGKVIIRAPNANCTSPVPTSEVVRMPPMNIVTPTNILRPMSPRSKTKGAYVNIQEAEGISLSPTKDNNQDYRPLADQPLKSNPDYIRQPLKTPIQTQSVPQPALSPSSIYPPTSTFNPNLYKNTSTLSPNHFAPDSTYWTLQQRKIQNQPLNNYNTLSSSKSLNQNQQQQSLMNQVSTFTQKQIPLNLSNQENESLRMSPINPRSNGSFKASTPTHDKVDEIANKITSPTKSTMSNEELYAVIHKIKKKTNIKSPPLDRAGSPALSTNSLSPGSSENSIPGRLTPSKLLPETGYLTDVRSRNSWAQNLNADRPACSDRLGPPPQTSRLDFKKLLLQHGVKLNLNPTKPSAKPSAVERLRLSRETGNIGTNTHPNSSNINILDLSGSPKTYTHRRVIRTNNINPSSPSRTNILIKESKTTPKILLSPKTQWRFSSPRSDVLSSPIPEAFNEDESPNSSNDKDQEQIINDFSTFQVKQVQNKGVNVKRNLIPIITENVPTNTPTLSYMMENGIVPISIENNNRESSPGKLSRAEMIQAQKLQFLNQTPPSLTPVKEDPIRKINGNVVPKCPSPTTLETAL